MKLWEIEEAIMNCVDEETGEIFDYEKLEALQIEREQKIEAICLLVKNKAAYVKALKEEEDGLKARRKVFENEVERHKEWLKKILDGQKFETTKAKVTFRNSEHLDIKEGAVIPKDFLKYKEPEIDKTLLKKAIKEGLQLDNVQISKRLNMTVK